MFKFSLRARAIVGGFLWIALALSLSGYVLINVFDDITEAAFDKELDETSQNLLDGIRYGSRTRYSLQTYVGDGQYRRLRSGRYWQVISPDGDVVLSPSFAGYELPNVVEEAGESILTRPGPNDGQIRVLARKLQVGDQGRWTVYVARSTEDLAQAKRQFRTRILVAFVALGASLVLAGAAQTGMALSPLVTLRAAFWSYRSGEEDRIRGSYPSDIEPLVDDLNDLLERNSRIITRARRQVADLAHALKTPAAIVRNEFDRLDLPKDSDARDALDRIDAQMARHMARARLAGADAPRAVTVLAPLVDGMKRMFYRIHSDMDLTIFNDVDPTHRLRCDTQDMEELIGTLMENAGKWTERQIRVSSRAAGDQIEIWIEDDGPGIPAEDRDEVMQAGVRLDEKKPGSGLGLAISSDIVEVYGGSLELEDSRLGGLKVICRLPSARD